MHVLGPARPTIASGLPTIRPESPRPLRTNVRKNSGRRMPGLPVIRPAREAHVRRGHRNDKSAPLLAFADRDCRQVWVVSLPK